MTPRSSERGGGGPTTSSGGGPARGGRPPSHEPAVLLFLSGYQDVSGSAPSVRFSTPIRWSTWSATDSRCARARAAAAA